MLMRQIGFVLVFCGFCGVPVVFDDVVSFTVIDVLKVVVVDCFRVAADASFKPNGRIEYQC